MRRAEMARRRKNLSEKRNEEEKVSSLFNLLLCDCPHFCAFTFIYAYFPFISVLENKAVRCMLETSCYLYNAPSNLQSKTQTLA